MTVPRVEILKINSTRPELIGLGPKKEIYKKKTSFKYRFNSREIYLIITKREGRMILIIKIIGV